MTFSPKRGRSVRRLKMKDLMVGIRQILTNFPFKTTNLDTFLTIKGVIWWEVLKIGHELFKRGFWIRATKKRSVCESELKKKKTSPLPIFVRFSPPWRS